MARTKMLKLGSHRETETTKGWAKAAPQRVDEMLRVYKKCGAGAFLRCDKRDPAASGYPIVATRATTCAPDCRGLRAAHARARQQRHCAIANKALRIAKQAKCSWAIGRRQLGRRKRGLRRRR